MISLRRHQKKLMTDLTGMLMTMDIRGMTMTALHYVTLLPYLIDFIRKI